MLNHATIKVMEAEKQKSDSEAEHLKRAAAFQAAEQDVHRLQKKLQRHIQVSMLQNFFVGNLRIFVIS
jgi:hypothetical protein